MPNVVGMELNRHLLGDRLKDAGQEIKSSERRRPEAPLKVYVAGPYSAPDVLTVLQNIRDGINASAKLFELGFAPYCPWLDYHYVLACEGDVPKERYQEASMAWLRSSDAVLLIGDWKSSKGTLAEIEEVKRLGIQTFTSVYDLRMWRNSRQGVWPWGGRS